MGRHVATIVVLKSALREADQEDQFSALERGQITSLDKISETVVAHLPKKHTAGFFFFFGLFRANPMAYGGSQARGLIGTISAGLCQSHSNTRNEPHLRPTPQFTAMLDF